LPEDLHEREIGIGHANERAAQIRWQRGFAIDQNRGSRGRVETLKEAGLRNEGQIARFRAVDGRNAGDDRVRVTEDLALHEAGEIEGAKRRQIQAKFLVKFGDQSQ
jgi:hypothetical protein